MNKNNLSIDYYHITNNNNDFKNLYDKNFLNEELIYIFTDSMCEKLIIYVEEFIFRINII